MLITGKETPNPMHSETTKAAKTLSPLAQQHVIVSTAYSIHNQNISSVSQEMLLLPERLAQDYFVPAE